MDQQTYWTKKEDLATLAMTTWMLFWCLPVMMLMSAPSVGWETLLKILGIGSGIVLSGYGVRLFGEKINDASRELATIEAQKRHIHLRGCKRGGPIVIIDTDTVYHGDVWTSEYELVYERAQCLECGSVTVYDISGGARLEA